ncbi:MAG: DUF4389 domain-containing protein [bacterium]
MSDNKPNCLNDGNIWCRLGYTALFGLIYSMADMVLVILVITQFCFLVFSGDKNKELARFGQQVSDYLYAILRFLTFNSDERPFPFAEWPKSPEMPPKTSPEPPVSTPEPPVSEDETPTTEEDIAEPVEVASEKPPAPTRKKASKKKTTRKKAATRKKNTTKKVSSASKQKEDNDS